MTILKKRHQNSLSVHHLHGIEALWLSHEISYIERYMFSMLLLSSLCRRHKWSMTSLLLVSRQRHYMASDNAYLFIIVHTSTMKRPNEKNTLPYKVVFHLQHIRRDHLLKMARNQSSPRHHCWPPIMQRQEIEDHT